MGMHAFVIVQSLSQTRLQVSTGFLGCVRKVFFTVMWLLQWISEHVEQSHPL